MSIIAAPPAPSRPADPRPVVQEPPARRRRGLLHWIGVGVGGVLLSLLLLVAVLVIGIPAVGGATPYTIVRGSMQPTLPPGTLVVVKPTPAADIRIGDVITYQLRSGRSEVVTHRVIAIQQPTTTGGEPRFVTKGDANDLADPVVRAAQVRGVVWYSVPLIGWVNDIVNGGSGTVVVPIAASALFVYAGWALVGHLVDRRRRRAALAGADA